MLYNAYSNEAAVMAANYHDIIHDDLFFAGLTAVNPEALMELWGKRRWAVHRNKIPFNPLSGINAKSNDPRTCVLFSDANAALDEYDGVEFLLGDGLCGIDLDHCIDPETGKVNAEALRIVDILDSYAELSPSGTGIHILVRGEMPFTGRQGSRDAAIQIEMYSECRFLTITGDAINNKPIANRTIEIKELADQYFPATDTGKESGTTSAPLDPDNSQKMLLSALEAIDPVDCDYMQWIRIGVGLKEAGLGADVWDYWSSKDPERYSPGECRKKWNTFKDPGQNSSGPGIIIELARENGWEASDVFDADEKDDYFRNKALSELRQMSHLEQASAAGTETEETEHKDESYKKTVQPIDIANIYDCSFSAAELVAMDLPEPEFFIDSFLAEGATILAGPPKIGKSLIAMDIGFKIALGEDFMQRHTDTAPVMIYSLEDSWSRLKGRMIKQGHQCIDPAHSPVFRISAPTFYDGLKESIEEFIAKNGKSLIILDTLQRISPPRIGRVSDYDYYYPFLSEISQIAREGHSSIILIHHTTKAIDENNPFNNILGTTAIQGATDAMVVITRNKKQRQEGKATLHYTGRDALMGEIEIAFNEDNLTWVEAESVEHKNSRESYELDPVMITIRTIMEKIEASDMINKEYIVTMSELLQTVRNDTGECTDMTPLQCGALVRKYTGLLEEDGIAVEKPQGNSRANGGISARYYKFSLIG